MFQPLKGMDRGVQARGSGLAKTQILITHTRSQTVGRDGSASSQVQSA